MHNIKVRYSDLQKAAERAKAASYDWQAVVLEILLLPNVNKRWKQLNPRRPDMQLQRIAGAKYPKGLALRQKIEDWSIYAGYTLSFSEHAAWNSVGEGTGHGYSHGPGVCWDGIRRETVYRFAYDLSVVYNLLSQHKPASHLIINLELDYSIIFVDDREE
jgi:hypothetical protein